MSTKNCILIPIHKKKVNWLLSFINSLSGKIDQDTTLLLAVSDEDEEEYFCGIMSKFFRHINIEYLNIYLYIKMNLKSEEILNRYTQNIDGCIVNLKKFIGLKYAAEQGYEWIIATDCDVIAIAETNKTFNLVEKNYNKGEYFGLQTDNWILQEILLKSLDCFSEQDEQTLKTTAMYIYTWFFDIPTYSGKDVKEFFSYMSHNNAESLNKWFMKINWHTFEHIVFIYWRLLQKNARIISYNELEIDIIPEEIAISDLRKIKFAFDYMPLWVTAKNYLECPASYDGLDHIVWLSHMDRL